MAMVCLCHGVNERRVRREIERGAHSVADVSMACDAGSCCQSCHPTIEMLIEETVLVSVRRGRRILRMA